MKNKNKKKQNKPKNAKIPYTPIITFSSCPPNFMDIFRIRMDQASQFISTKSKKKEKKNNNNEIKIKMFIIREVNSLYINRTNVRKYNNENTNNNNNNNNNNNINTFFKKLASWNPC